MREHRDGFGFRLVPFPSTVTDSRRTETVGVKPSRFDCYTAGRLPVRRVEERGAMYVYIMQRIAESHCPTLPNTS